MPVWVCMASAVTTAPSRSRGASSSGRAGISLDLSATRLWVRAVPAAWSRAARRWGAGLEPVRAPRMVLPSTAITLRPAMAPVRVKNHDVRRASRPAGSRSWRTRLIVDFDGRARPASRPRAPRSAGSRSAACSHIAVRLRHPASIPVTARHRTETRGWRTPRRSRGSVTPFRTSFRGWRDRAVVVDDGMAARPPGGEVDSSTAHRSGGAAPHPRQHADNPGHQTTPHRLCRPPANTPGPIRVGPGVRR
ncbi:hypothetical protein AM609_06815 [Actinomyces sp. oral taxon 414]|nr:hypothetical protein AM609_06815 [Actinomyces sp. oral taxon 414]